MSSEVNSWASGTTVENYFNKNKGLTVGNRYNKEHYSCRFMERFVFLPFKTQTNCTLLVTLPTFLKYPKGTLLDWCGDTLGEA